jgi:hypothetical protein
MGERMIAEKGSANYELQTDMKGIVWPEGL